MNTNRVLKAQIIDEREKLRNLLTEATEIAGREASSIHVRAGASVIHDFYTGVENIFHAVATVIDDRVPVGQGCHVELLHQMTLDIEGLRRPVISEKTERML
ncbi:MAG: hypothetical protein JW950_02680 [Deltaproteobacteria bacterium]|nr:hypothetical protein [Deltaproteobacteria bacterium]